MLKNFWYVIEWSSAVTAKPMRARLLGQDFVLYRKSNGQVVALSDVCIHRGGSLSDGWRDGDGIVCPYHAWTYQSDGACVRIPAAGKDSAIPRKARVPAYEVQERYGWVWIFIGDVPADQRPPIPDFGPEFDDPSFTQVRGEWTWNANYERVVENGTDVTHVNWVHNFATREDPEVRDLVLEETDWSCSGTLTLRPPLRRSRGVKGWFDRRLHQRPDQVTTTVWYLPAMVMIHVRLPGLGAQLIYDANIPVDENVTRTLWIGGRNFFTSSIYNRATKKRIDRIFAQDEAIVERVKPELVPIDLAAELHHKTDAVSVAYRKRRQELLAMGWGLEGRPLDQPAPRATVAEPEEVAPKP